MTVLATDHANALMIGRQKIIVEDLRSGVRHLRRQGNERRQILIDRSQPVTDPGSDAGPREEKRTGVHAERRVVVLVVIPVHRLDDTDVVHAFPQIRKQITDQRATLAAGLEFPQWL